MILVGSTYICIYSHTCIYIHNDNKEEKVMNLGWTEDTGRVGVGKRGAGMMQMSSMSSMNFLKYTNTFKRCIQLKSQKSSCSIPGTNLMEKETNRLKVKGWKWHSKHMQFKSNRNSYIGRRQSGYQFKLFRNKEFLYIFEKRKPIKRIKQFWAYI